MTTANGQEYHVGGFIFTAGFDSGNLGGVALEEEDEDEEVVAAGRDPSPTLRPSTSPLPGGVGGGGGGYSGGTVKSEWLGYPHFGSSGSGRGWGRF